MAIRERTTVFEENALNFCRKRGFRGRLPPGYRATWDQREQLAAAKLEGLLRPDMKEKDFPQILLRSSGKPSEDEFIEVHIYGPLHRLSIERAVVREVSHPPDTALLLELKHSLEDATVGASVETYK
jgi:hypothetical protein